MKNYIVLSLLFVFVSCTSQEKKPIQVVQNVSVEEFNKMIAQKGTQLVDVRTPTEFKAGHLEKAKLINIFDKDFEEQSLKVLDKSKPVYVYCRSGGRSANAAEIYKKAGFTKVYNLVGGYGAWSAKKLKTIK
ncbi:hypothetical protein GCM10011416_10710 [Polaribacter pacificus]|uniref:Rhodanese domain-containing protein n=1 Tax=Polaribacter pacificus TaxID=1775173 RepID=A0A917MCY3_9FLAO|nr:rhodanese-like domain-containing protein [Polaribacter pacificus]GGG95109.1 hypothetical protein GCM10011416_10710 [Polaribacter pacificus]